MRQPIKQISKRLVSAVAFLLILLIPVQILASEAGLKPSTLRIAVATAPVSLDGMHASGAAASRLLRLIAPPLVVLAENGELDMQASVASSITRQGEKTYIAYLKDKTFHDGKKLKASHIVALFDALRAENSTSPLKSYLDNVEKVTAFGDGVVQIVLKEPSPWFYSILENIPLVEVDHPTIGVGDYQLVSLDDYGNVTLKRMDGAVFEFFVVKDPMVRLLKLMRLEVDVVHGDLPTELYDYGVKKGLEGLAVPSYSYTYIGFNLENGAGADLAVRQAVSLAVNRPLIIESLLGGRARFAPSLLLEGHKHFWGMDERLTAYNVAHAIEILENAGYKAGVDGIRLHLKMRVTTNPSLLRLAQVLQQQLLAIGVDLQVSSLEWGAFYDHVKKGSFESYILSWVGRFQPDFFRYVFHSDMMPPKGANRGRFNNAQMDKALDQLMVEMDDDKIHTLSAEVQKIAADNMIYVPLWRASHLALARAGLGYVMERDGGYSGLDQLLR